MRLENVSRYACYYGYGRLAQLATYDLAIIQASAYAPDQIAWLQAQGTQAIAYLSVGERPAAEADPAWVARDATGAPLRNPAWDTVLLDCRAPAYREHVLDIAIPPLLDWGVTGLFLDTIDVQDALPETRPGVVALLRAIRATYPDLVLLANRGFTILDTAASVTDGIVFEAFTTHHDGRRYAAWPAGDLLWTEAMAHRVRAAAPGLSLLALDYAAPGDSALRDLATARARAHGMPSFVGPRALDWLP